MKGTTEHLGGALGTVKGVWFGVWLWLLFIIIITTFTTIRYPAETGRFGTLLGDGMGMGDMAFFEEMTGGHVLLTLALGGMVYIAQ